MAVPCIDRGVGTNRACPRPHALPSVLITSALLLALLAPLALADEALRVVTWNLETVGTPGNALGPGRGLTSPYRRRPVA